MRPLLVSALAAAMAAVGAATPAGAQSGAWTLDTGLAARLRPAHLGSSQYLIDAVPIVEANNGEQLQISFDDGVKWSALRVGQVSAGPIAEYRQSFNDQLPKGAFRMHDALELGGFAAYRTPVGVAEARLRRAVNGYQGWSGELSFSSGATIARGFSLGGQARLSWADSNFTQEYFGLRPHAAARAGLPPYLSQDFVTLGGELDAAEQLTPRARLILQLSADRMVEQLPATPLFDNRNIFTASLGLTYRWAGARAAQEPREQRGSGP